MRRRRELILAAGLMPLATPLAVLAQPTPRMRQIGYLSLGNSASEVGQLTRSIVRESLRRAGWEEGRNLMIERRYAEGDLDRLDAMARELVRLDVELIYASLNAPILAAKKATSNIPIVMSGAVEPVQLGIVQSLAHPGGNVTGAAAPGVDTAAKSVQILRDVAPDLTRLAILSNLTSQSTQTFNDARIRAASSLGMTVEVFAYRQSEDLTVALQRIAASKAQMLVVNYDGIVESRLRDITDFAVKHKILSIGTATVFTTVGGALYYGSSLQEIIDRAVSFIDRILRGAKPADLPVEQPTNFDLIVNLKTMRALGISVPQSVLLRATELIQ